MKNNSQNYSELVKKFPEEVKSIFEVFGDSVRLVGGSVRDLLIGKKVKDFDFATKFLPQQVIEILEKNNIKAIPTGVKFGTITAVVNNKNFEITTLRKDNETDGRHCEPEFVDDFLLDAQRRDFTMNALYLDAKGQIYDYFGGIQDLEAREVKFIGAANKRIEEDYLRILRFFRFSCEYSKSLDSQGLAACIMQKSNLKKLSRERIRAEFLKMLSTTKTQNLLQVLHVMQKEKIIEEIFSSELDIAALESLLKFNADESLKLKIAVLFLQRNLDLTVLFQEICATNIEKKYWKYFLLQKPMNFNLQDIRHLLAFEEKDLVLDFYIFNCIKNSFPLEMEIVKFLNQFISPQFPLKGDDAMDLGLKAQEVGDALKRARIFWAESGFKADRAELLAFLARKQ